MAQLKTSIHNYGASNTGVSGTVNLDPITYNPRYPGFDETNYRKLESKIDALGLTGSEREKAMDEAYRQILPIVQNEIKNSDRREYINQAQYEVSQIQDPEAKRMAQGKLTVTELAQKLKEKYNLDPSANDEDVFNSWINSLPNGGQLLADYMNDGNRELLYQGGLETKQEVPEAQEPTVGGIQGIINEQSQTGNDTFLGKTNNILDRGNPIGKITQWVDGLVQKIPTATYETKVQNLANKMNSLTEDEYQNLYDQYVRMIENGSDEKWKNDDRDGWALFWDAITGDKDALDRVNTLHLYDYSDVLTQDGVERNSWGTQLWDKVANGATLEEINQNIDAQNAPKISKALAKGSVWTTDKMKNLLNFVGRSYGGLQNYAEALGVGLQKMDDIRDNRFAPTAGLENNEEAFTAYVADKVANFGEYMTDAPDTLLGNPVSPNAVKFFSNIPQSFLKTLTAKVRGKTNPLDTKIGLAKMLFTDEGQQALINRYGSPEALANTMNTDPVGLASDMIDMADKFNLVLNKTTGGAVERQSFGDVTDALSDDFVKGLGNALNYTSNWLNNKGKYKTAGLVDITTDAALNPSKLAQDITKESKMIANDVSEIPADIQEWARERANKKLQNINRMKKGEQEEFKQMSKGIDQGEFQNQRGLKNTEDLANYLTKNLEQVDTAMEAIQGRRRSKELDTVMDDVLKYAVDTEDPRAGRLQELYNKNKEGGLEMKEINEVKRYYERTNIFDYLKDSTKGKQRRRATNRDTALREWQYKIAEEAGLDNLKELNQETRLTKYLLDNATDRKAGVKGNNDVSLTDWIVASGGGLDAAGIAALVGKKVYQSNWFQEKLVDVYNYIGGRELIDTPKVDMSKIQQSNVDRAILAKELADVQTKEDFNKRLKKAEAMAGPALPYNENFNGEPTTTIRVTPEGQSIRQGQISEIQSEAPSNYVNNGVSNDNLVNRVREMYKTMPAGEIESYLLNDLNLSIKDTNDILAQATNTKGSYGGAEGNNKGLDIDQLKLSIDQERDPLGGYSERGKELQAQWAEQTDYYSENPQELLKLANEGIDSPSKAEFIQEATLKMLLGSNTPEGGEEIGRDILDKINKAKNTNASPTTFNDIKFYTAEELGLPPVSKTMLRNLDTSKYGAVEDPETGKIVFYKMEDVRKVPIYQNGRRIR